MSTRTDYDVIVVGAGPAGVTAATVLSRAGLRVSLVESRAIPRDKLCGGLLTPKTVILLQRLFGHTPDALEQRRVLDFKSADYEAFHRTRSLGRFRPPHSFYFVKRPAYDAFLVEQARAAGARLIDDRTVLRFDPDHNALFIDDGTRLTARFIIGADGHASVIRRAFPPDRFDRAAWHRNSVVALQADAPRHALDRTLDHPMIYFGFARHGYCWAFPNSDRILVGIGCLVRANRPPLGRLFRDFLVEAGWRALLHRPVRAGRIPSGSLLRRPAHRRALLVGDAAGLVDPLTGEGIYYAQRSAELAAQSIIDIDTAASPAQTTIDTERSARSLVDTTPTSSGLPTPPIIHTAQDDTNLQALYLARLHKHIYPHLRRRRTVRRLFFGLLPIAPVILRGFHSNTLRTTVESHLQGLHEESLPQSNTP